MKAMINPKAMYPRDDMNTDIWKSSVDLVGIDITPERGKKKKKKNH